MTGDLISSVEKLVQTAMAGFDPSHDDLHVFRVRKMALKLAAQDSQIDPIVVELAALGHDLTDYKYSTDEFILDELSNLMKVNGISEQQRSTVLKIIQNTSFSKEKKMKASGQWTQWHESCKEFHCVQDADRLDALGAIGIFRVSAYSGAKGRPLYHPDCSVSSTYSHFFEKLLTLPEWMKTDLGREVAKKRVEIMKSVVELAKIEYELQDF